MPIHQSVRPRDVVDAAVKRSQAALASGDPKAVASASAGLEKAIRRAEAHEQMNAQMRSGARRPEAKAADLFNRGS